MLLKFTLDIIQMYSTVRLAFKGYGPCLQEVYLDVLPKEFSTFVCLNAV